MKSYNHLFEKVVDEANLNQAIDNAIKGKRNRFDVKKILANREEHIKKLKNILLNQEFKARKHKAMIIKDGSSKKERLVIQPDIKDEQFIHHAVVQVLKPIFLKGMYEFSCGSIPNRGGHYGKKYVEKFIRRHKADIKYVLKFDIRHFYPNIDTDILKAKLSKLIHDDKMLYLLGQIIDSNVAVMEDGSEKTIGVPIGYYTSQWFANWFLQDIDHFIKEKLKVKCYVRYVDDFVIFGRNKKELHKYLKEIEQELTKLNLKLKGNYQVYRFDYIDKEGKRKGRPLDFMGFKFYRDKTTLRRTIMLKATRKAKKMYKKKKLTWFDCCQLISYMGYFLATDTYGTFQKYIKPYVNIKNCKRQISIRQNKINIKETKNGTKLDESRKQTVPSGT